MNKLVQLLILTLTILTANNMYCWEWPKVWPWKISKPRVTTIRTTTTTGPSIAYTKNEAGDLVPLDNPEQNMGKIHTIVNRERVITESSTPIGPSKEAVRNYMRTYEGNYPGHYDWVTKKEQQRAQSIFSRWFSRWLQGR